MRASQPPVVVKVSFLIAGTQKGGTSALNRYLRRHPEICMAKRKEVHFFDDEAFFERDPPDYAAYHRFFTSKPSGKLLGEATPSYMYWYDAPKRIWHYNPDMKFIIILRNPIFRAFSHWNMQRNRKLEPLSFWEAIQMEAERCRQALPYQNKMFSYVDRGFYGEQLRRVWRYFGRSRTLILRHEELRINPRETLDKISRFLGTNCVKRVREKTVHRRRYRSAMSRQEWTYLRDIFEYEIRALERMLDWECSDWFNEPEFGS